MKIESRFARLERTVAAWPSEGIRRTRDVPEDIWQRAMHLLRTLPPEHLAPWKSAEHIAECCRECEPQDVTEFPDPILDCLMRAVHEALTGTLPPPWKERARLALADLENWSDDRMIDFLRQRGVVRGDYALPPPYSPDLVEQVAGIKVLWRAEDLAGKLRRREITAQQHAAELAAFLPPVTRADLLNTLRNLPANLLGANLEPPLEGQ